MGLNNIACTTSHKLLIGENPGWTYSGSGSGSGSGRVSGSDSGKDKDKDD